MDELVRCSFSLNKTECNLLMRLMKQPKAGNATAIAKAVGLDRTTAQKALTTLVERGLAEKFQENLPHGSYTFIYRSKQKGEIKADMLKTVRNWSSAVEKQIEKI